MKRIIARIVVLLIGVMILACGLVHYLPWTMIAGILMFVFGFVAVIDAEMYNRSQWARLMKYYLREKNMRTQTEMEKEMTDIELDDLKEKMKATEIQPSVIYVGGMKPLTEALNRAHARNMLKVSGREVHG